MDDLKKSINPVEAVAYGAAVQAFKLKGMNAKTRDFFVKDVVPLSLGTSNENKMDIIIKRNSVIPIASYLNKDIKKSINVNEAVAYGAAIQTFNLKDKTAKTRDFLVKNFVPLSLGTSNGNKMDIIVEKILKFQ